VQIVGGVLRHAQRPVVGEVEGGLATELPVGPANGLDHDSVINLDNVFTVDQGSLGRRVGFLLDDQEPALAEAVINAFDLDAFAK